MSELAHYDRGITPAEVLDLVGPSPFIIEIGCNDGEDTEAMLRVMPNAHFICFEPERRALDRFRLRNHPQVALYECGIGHRVGSAKFWASTGNIPGSAAPCKHDWDYSGGFSAPTGHLIRDKVVKFKEPIELPTVTLDYYYDEYQHPIDLIWADTQGSEAKVIRGGNRTLLSTRYLYTEIYPIPQYDKQPTLDALISFLPDFDLIATYGENVLFKNRSL